MGTNVYIDCYIVKGWNLSEGGGNYFCYFYQVGSFENKIGKPRFKVSKIKECKVFAIKSVKLYTSNQGDQYNKILSASLLLLKGVIMFFVTWKFKINN